MYLFAKRVMDFTLSLSALIVLLPLFIPIVLILKFTGEGEIFYLQSRVGHKGKKFSLYKFATMLKASPSIGSGTITLQNDPRVLPIGKFLRSTKINELPQILNIIKGEISIVGPRPQTEECFSYFPQEYHSDLLELKPGLTGIGSIVFRDEESIIGNSKKSYSDCYREDIMPYKARLELWYKKNRSIKNDIIIIFLTAFAIISPKTNLCNSFFGDLPKN